VFYPDKFAAPVANDSEIFDYDNWVRDGWELKIGWQKLGTDARFPRAAPGADRSRAVGFRAAPATTSCSPARTSTRPRRKRPGAPGFRSTSASSTSAITRAGSARRTSTTGRASPRCGTTSGSARFARPQVRCARWHHRCLVPDIRDYEPGPHAAGVRACIVELQNYERTLEPALLDGEAMADVHLAYLVDCCRDYDGRIFVALTGARVVGFACVWTRVPPDGPDDIPIDHAYISDVAVIADLRGRGLGRALLQRAEAYARERGAAYLRVGVRAGNAVARQLYAAVGFTEDRIELAKRL